MGCRMPGKVQAHPTGHMVLPGLAETATQRRLGGRFPLCHLLQFSLTQHLGGCSVAQGHLCCHAHLAVWNASPLQGHNGQLSHIPMARGSQHPAYPEAPTPATLAHGSIPILARPAGMALRIDTSQVLGVLKQQQWLKMESSRQSAGGQGGNCGFGNQCCPLLPTAAPSTALEWTGGVCQESCLRGGSPSTCPRRTHLSANHLPLRVLQQGKAVGQHSC